MSSNPIPAVFQSAAITHIAERLRDTRGAQRFLLADEVGLGKTIVARGVIDELSKRRRSPLKVVYLCSNAEIAEQNRRKLVADAGAQIRRATELAFKTSESSGRAHLFAFTPGTSLSGGSGAAWERRLMLFLLNNIWREDVSMRKWRDFFCCSVALDRWLTDTTWSRLASEFGGRIRADFRKELICVVHEHYGTSDTPADLLELVSSYDPGRSADRAARNKIVGKLRGLMQLAAVRSLNPDLIILDEVQRFREVLDQASDSKRVAGALLGGRVPVLILSATPYRLLTLAHEETEAVGGHHEQFHSTIRFLFGKDKKTPTRIQDNLERFGHRLRNCDLNAARDPQLLSLKREVEVDLKRVICRTERNWYMLDQRHGITECGASQVDFPGHPEMQEFFEIHRGLAAHLSGVGLVSEFWKSSPSLLTYMDGDYALMRRLRSGKVRVAPGLLSRPSEPSLPGRNLRLRRLISHALGNGSAAPPLWTRPTYTYFRDEAYGDSAPRKMLVFTGWRFVPKAVAVAVSQCAVSRLPRARDEQRQPLRFGEKASFHVFDVCFPSVALAGLVTPLKSAAGTRDVTEWEEEVQVSLQQALSSASIMQVEGRGDPLWSILARLESNGVQAQAVRTALQHLESQKDSSAGFLRQHSHAMLNLMAKSASPLSIGRTDFARLVRITASSPAVSLVRSLLSVFGQDDVFLSLRHVFSLCMNELRAYWNRPLQQQAVRTYYSAVRRRRRSGKKLGFAEQVLLYARDHHLQAVLDEHVYLLRNAATFPDVVSSVAHFRSVWSLGTGSRRVNTAVGSGASVRIGHDKGVWPTHFALAFGDETIESTGTSSVADERMRRSDVRQAFNSPFWPFVLATTSVGQEGLDFHLHCRDVFHWNLPSNPVDLEQREGRINRRDCLAVRESIVKDWPLELLRRGEGGLGSNPWSCVFERLATDHSTQRYKHGLYPHWLYECRNPADTVRIARHVAFHASSRDIGAYSRLKSRLALYRLVFGQANQEHLLDGLESRLGEISEENRNAALHRLAGYMLNLSPFSEAAARRLAQEEAEELLAEPGTSGLSRLIQDVERLIGESADDLAVVRREIDVLALRVRTAVSTGRLKTREIRKAVGALCYLRNPYDQYFDSHGHGGFDDDIAVLRAAIRR